MEYVIGLNLSRILGWRDGFRWAVLTIVSILMTVAVEDAGNDSCIALLVNEWLMARDVSLPAL